MNFDIRCEPWIPVRSLDGEENVLGLKDLFRQAATLEKLDGLDAMSEYGLYRFLSVFLTAAYQPKHWEDKCNLLETGQFDLDLLQNYIRRCEDEGVSFNIFDKKRPFLQAMPDPAYDLEKNIKSIAELDNTKASGNNPIHFDHTLENKAIFTPAEAIRGLLAAQIFCTAGLKGPSNVNGAPPMFFLPKGRNLFETLVLSMCSLSGKNIGKPLWENKRVIVPQEEVVSTEFLYGMLFPSRRLRLIEKDGMVQQVYYQPGLHFTGFTGWHDPHVAYRLNKDKAVVSIKPSVEREPWRNIGPIARNFNQNAPLVLLEFGKIQEEMNISRMPVMIFGVATSNASYLDMQRGVIFLDSRIADKALKGGVIAKAVNFTEEVSVKLRLGLRNMISPNDSERGVNEVKQYLHRYFSLCEEEFYQFEDKVAAENIEYSSLLKYWQECVRGNAYKIVALVQKNYCYQASELVRAQKATDWLSIEICKLMKGESAV